MVVRCPQCRHTRSVSESLIPPGASVATCPVCGCRFRFRNPHGHPDAEASPVRSPASADTGEQATTLRPASSPGGPAPNAVAPAAATGQSFEMRDPVADHRLFPKKNLLVRAPLERDDTMPAEAGRRVPVESPPAGHRVFGQAPAEAGADTGRNAVVRRRQALDPPPAETAPGDVWDAVDRLGALRQQSSEVPRAVGPGPARATADLSRASADVQRDRLEQRAASELRGRPAAEPARAAPAGDGVRERSPDLLRRLFGRNKKKQRPPAATLEIMLPGLSGNDGAESTPADDAGRTQDTSLRNPETPARVMPPAEPDRPERLTPTASERPDRQLEPGIPGSPLPTEPGRSSPTGADIPGGQGNSVGSGMSGVPSEMLPLSRLSDLPSQVDAAGHARPRVRFPYAEEGPDPEARVEQDLRMLQDSRNAPPQRDLGRLREFPDDMSGDNAGPGVGGAGGVPWENPAFYGWIGGFTATLRGVMFRGPEFFSSLGNEGSPALGYLFFVLTGYICILGSSAWSLAAEELLPGVLPLPPGRVVLPLLLLLAPAALGLMLLFSAGFIRIVLRVFAPDRADFVSIYKVVCYAPAPFVLCIVPFVGPPLAAIWFLVSMPAGCRRALGISRPLALFAALPPALLMLVGLAACFL